MELSHHQLAYSTIEASMVTGRSLTRIKQAIRDGELPARRDGKLIFIERGELLRWLESMPAANPSKRKEA
jgi:excisionase family DNA binding protein